MTAPSDRIVIAVVTKPHGLKGQVRIKVFNDETTALRVKTSVTVTVPGSEPRRLRISAAQATSPTWLVSFEGVSTLADAEALRNAEISVLREELPPPDEGEFYHADLVGCAVVDAAGAAVGTVKEVTRYPSVDALVLHDGKEIPLVDAMVTSVDLATRTIVVDGDAVRDLLS